MAPLLFFVFCVPLIPRETNACASFCSQFHFCFYLFHHSVSLHVLCWVVFFQITHTTYYNTPFYPSACEHHIVLWRKVPEYWLQEEFLKCGSSWRAFASQSPAALFFCSIPNSLQKMEGWDQYNNKGRSKRKIIYSLPMLNSCFSSSQQYENHSYSVWVSIRNRKHCKRTELVFLHYPVQIHFETEQQLYGTKSSTDKSLPNHRPQLTCDFYFTRSLKAFWFL